VNSKAAKQERRLLALFETMSDTGREMLLEYAEFLAQRHTRPVSLEPLDIPRPEQESVAAAIRRLADTFPMLDRAKLLGAASGLMAQHVMYARPAPEVIDELEVVFRRHYTLFVERRQDDEPE
jgi:hypothetical protein